MTRLLRRLRADDGWAVVTAISLMMIMLGIGLATLSTVDVQQRQASNERNNETRFTLAEAVLNAQVFALSRSWPSTADFNGCSGTLSSALPAGCPDVARLAGAFGGAEYTGATFTTAVYDNANASSVFYDDGVTPSQARRDLNADDRLWVRASATVRGRIRTIVALVRLDRRPLNIPARSVLAGKVNLGANGNPTVIDAKGASAEAGQISVRCDITDPNCVSPKLRDPNERTVVPAGVVDPDPYPSPTALDEASIESLYAQAEDTGRVISSGCPALPTSGGGVVWFRTGGCRYNGGTAFTATQPGIIVVEQGDIEFGGSATANAIVYALNRSTPQSTGYLVKISGNATINGAVFVDGNAGFDIQDMANKLNYDNRYWGNHRATGDGSIVRNTWRELPTVKAP